MSAVSVPLAELEQEILARRNLLWQRASEFLSARSPPYIITGSSNSESLIGIHQLPRELICIIFSHLDFAALLACRLVCRTWRHLMYHSKVTIPSATENIFLHSTALFPSAICITAVPKHLITDACLRRIREMKYFPAIDVSELLLDDLTRAKWGRKFEDISREMIEDYAASIRWSSYAIQVWKNPDFRLFIMRGEILLYSNRFKEALEDFKKAIELRPSSPLAHAWMARALGAINGLTEAIKYLDECDAKFPNDRNLVFSRGFVYSKYGFWKEALEAFKRIAVAETRSVYSCGLARHELGLYEEAVKDFTTVISAKAYSCAALYRRAAAYSKLGMKDLAEKDISAVLEIKPRIGRDWFAHAQVYALRGSNEEAIKCFDRALILLPDVAEYLCCRGRTYQALGRHVEAVLDFTRAAQLIPHDKLIQAERDAAIQLRDSHPAK